MSFINTHNKALQGYLDKNKNNNNNIIADKFGAMTIVRSQATHSTKL